MTEGQTHAQGGFNQFCIKLEHQQFLDYGHEYEHTLWKGCFSSIVQNVYILETFLQGENYRDLREII